MRQANAWVVAAVAAILGACGTDAPGAADDADAGPGDVEFVDWQPSGKDATNLDADVSATDAVNADAASDVADVLDAGDAPQYDVTADIGGGLPSEITAIHAATTFFDFSGIHEVALTVAPADWTAYLDGVNQPDGQKVYNWYQADVQVDGTAFKTIGIKGFGNGSQIDNPAKPNVRLKFDQYNTAGVGPDGEQAFRLKASGQDPTFVREPIAGAMLRAIGGDAPRFSWAHVAINGSDYGVYELQESVDKRFFANAFNNKEGNKFEPTIGCMGIDCPDAGGCAALKPAYTGSPGDPQAIVDAAQAITDATDDQLPTVLDKYFVVDELLADYAVDAVLSNLDGFAAAGQNFTIYGDQNTKKFHLIATGVDLTFGNFNNAWYDLALPWGAPNSWCATRTDQLYQRIWQNPVLKPLLLAKFQALQCGLFRATTLLPLIDSFHTALKPLVYSDPQGLYTPKQLDADYVALDAYVTARQKTLSDLLGPCK